MDLNARGRTDDHLFRLILGGALVVLSILALPLLTGRIYWWGDLGNLHLPLRRFYADCLSAGDGFDWMPQMFCGFYLQAEGEAGMYHPLHLALYWLLPLETAFTLELLLCYPALLAGMFLWLRRWPITRSAAMFGAFVFGLSGFSMMQYVHLNIVSAVAHIPWLLLVTDLAMRETDPRRLALARFGVAGLTASQFLLGHPQMLLYSAIAESLYVVLMLALTRSWRRLEGWGLAKFAGVLGGGVQMVPSLDLLSTWSRSEKDLSFTYTLSLHPLNLVQLANPYVFGLERRYFGDGNDEEWDIYNGAVPVMMLIVAILQWRQLGRLRLFAAASAGVGVLALVLALGDYGYLYRIQAHIPLLNSFRCPSRYIMLFHLATAVCAAVGLDHLRQAVPGGCTAGARARVRPMALLVLLAIVVCAVALAFRFTQERLPDSGVPGRPGAILLGAGIVAVTAGLAAGAALKVRYMLAGLIVFAMLDMSSHALTWVWRHPPASVIEIASTVPLPPSGAEGRFIYPSSMYVRPLLHNVRLVNGYAGSYPLRVLVGQRDAFLWLANMRYLYDGELGFVPVNGAPRVRFVKRVEVCPDVASRVAAVDLSQVALVEERVGLDEGSGEAPSGVAVIATDRPGWIEIAAALPTAQFLVLSESYHSGWQATVDGAPVKVVRAYGDFMGCAVPAGKHTIVFRFAPLSLTVGKLLSLAGIALAAVQFFLSRRALADAPPKARSI